MTYDFLAFENSSPANRRPIFVRTLRQVHHDTETDVAVPERDETSRVRLINRTVSVDYCKHERRVNRFASVTQSSADKILLGGELPAGNDIVGIANGNATQPNVVVSAWQIKDNKGRVVEQYQPFFSTGWDYAPALQQQLGQKSTLFYDPRGELIRTVNPDGSEQRVTHGVPVDLANAAMFSPSSWEAYTYDSNDNAGRTPAADPNRVELRTSLEYTGQRCR